jgi:hypothetical protein
MAILGAIYGAVVAIAVAAFEAGASVLVCCERSGDSIRSGATDDR